MRRVDGIRRRYWRWRGQPRFGTVALAYTPAGKLLFIRQTYSVGWCLPGGGRRSSEEPAKAALRELYEEIGLLSGDAQWLTTIHRPSSGVPTAIDVVKVSDAVFAFRRSLEVEAVSAFDPAALPANLNPWTVTVLKIAGILDRGDNEACPDPDPIVRTNPLALDRIAFP